MKYLIGFVLCLILSNHNFVFAQQDAKFTEYQKEFTTYPFSDPDPIANFSKIYPYFRFDGFTETGVQKKWKVVEIENDFIKIYTLQKKIRVVEEKIAENYKYNKMRCPTHLSIGQEAVATASALALNKNDISISYHRSHAHYLAKGGSVRKLFAELHGYEEGCSKGIGGSMHLIDLNNNFYGSTAIVSNSIPIGVGLAYSLKINKKKNLVCIYIGDAALEEGVFYESLNFCIIKKLPVVFLCENNFYSVYTHIKHRQPINRKPFELAKGLGANSFKLNQTNPYDLYKKLKNLITQRLCQQNFALIIY